MGYYTEYFSTIFKGVRMTAMKERWETRRVVNNLKKSDHTLYKTLFEDIEQKHRVTKALKEEDSLLKNLQKAAENGDKLIFNVTTEEMTLLKTVEKILIELEKFPDSKDKNVIAVEREFVLAVLHALQKAEALNYQEFKWVRNIVALSEDRDASKFMQAVRLTFQKKDMQTLLAKFATRMEIRRIKTDLIKLGKVPASIRKIGQRLTSKKQNERIKDIVDEFYVDVANIKRYLFDAFHETFLLMKRDSIFLMKILNDLNNLFNFNLKWINQHFMPQQSVKEKNDRIFEIEKKIAKQFHIMAQAFNIMLRKMRDLEKITYRDAAKFGIA